MPDNNPFHRLPEVPSCAVTSMTVTDGAALGDAQMSGVLGVPGGEDVSPHLSWSGAPDGTRGYAVTVFDPDAPTQSGIWHWSVANIPADVDELPVGAGAEGGAELPAGAFQLRNDIGFAGFVGAAPPAGHGRHRYFVTVHALDTDDIGVPEDASPAFLNFQIASHILARAIIVPTAEIPAED